jgi:nucleoid-associated protein YgaU
VPININAKSRLRFKEFLSIDGVEFWELDELPTIPESASDFYYMVKEGDRIDLLANRFYGDSNLWWVIAVANNIDIIPTNLVTASTIRIPSPLYVQQNLFSGNNVVQ